MKNITSVELCFKTENQYVVCKIGYEYVLDMNMYSHRNIIIYNVPVQTEKAFSFLVVFSHIECFYFVFIYINI